MDGMVYTQQRQDPVERPPVRRKRRGREAILVPAVLVLALAGFVFYVDHSLRRESALPADGQRPVDGPGTNWLLVGSDSREGLDAARQEELGTGDTAGRRPDTVMLVHLPEGDGQPTMVSLPRDSYLAIPGHGKDKLNAAFAFGGPRLLTSTVENATGVRIDHYAEVGLGGFADITDAIGGVELCVAERMKDAKANLDLQPGCQVLDGPQALGYVRTRESARGDLERVERQREFLVALTDQASSPAVLLNPFKFVPLILKTSDAFLVGEDDHVWHLAGLAFAMNGIASGDGVTTTAPFGGFSRSADGGSVVKWDEARSERLFGALAADTPVPPDAITQPD
jgi:LCP family protein required for cell wall assembly